MQMKEEKGGVIGEMSLGGGGTDLGDRVVSLEISPGDRNSIIVVAGITLETVGMTLEISETVPMIANITKETAETTPVTADIAQKNHGTPVNLPAAAASPAVIIK